MNVLDFIFINLAFAVTFTGLLINNFEKYVPAFIKKGFKYGSFAYQGNDANFLQIIEIPKSCYRHFYLISAVVSVITTIYMILIYFFNVGINQYIPIILKGILQNNGPSVSVCAALVAMLLLTVQCVRRLYETYCLQVFAKTSKINLSHYAAGIVHYIACFIAILGEAPVFGGKLETDLLKWTDTWTSIYSTPCILVFLWAWYEQFQSNIIFADLRKDKKTRQVVTEAHSIPRGRLFELVSSPHRMCEIIMYSTLLLLIPTYTFFYIYLWVLSNQIQTAIQAHEWYKNTFKHYPANRCALIPCIL